jgi:O-glycosyl hydrolase
MTRFLAFVLLAATGVAAASENATFDSAGGLTSVVDHGSALPLHGRLMASFDGDVEVELQPHDQRSPITRDGSALRWSGSITAPNGAKLDYVAEWRTQPEPAIALTVSQPGDYPVLLRSLDFVVDLPRSTFVGGTFSPGAVALASTKPADATFFRANVAELQFADAAAVRRLALVLDRARAVSLADRWDAAGRSYRVRIQLHAGPLAKETVSFGVSFRFDAAAVVAPAAHLTVAPAERLQPFDGFGANLCWAADNAVTEYTRRNLRMAWSRHELKAILWDLQRAEPGKMLTDDFERIRSIQQAGVPWIISLWRLPERLYTDPNRAPLGTFGRKIAGERWPELLELIGSYLEHLKTKYGAEPDLISFNEPDLGVNVGLTPEEHRDAVKRIGAHLAKLGFKTKFLLGDTANPRDTHRYVLATAADTDAMRYVGAVSFHSWGGGSPEQYRAWAEVAAWLGLPLIVGEAGTDPGSWRNKTFDSYAYGLDEARQTQELLRYARPQALLYWQFTADYGLARVNANGAVEPTGRLWLMKHFTDLTPQRGVGIATASDQADVLVGAFARGEELVVHILNTGPATVATIAGLPAGNWRTVTTTEAAGFQETPAVAERPEKLDLPARCLVTLVRVPVAPPAR